jgi:hypothetical protein
VSQCAADDVLDTVATARIDLGDIGLSCSSGRSQRCDVVFFNIPTADGSLQTVTRLTKLADR